MDAKRKNPPLRAERLKKEIHDKERELARLRVQLVGKARVPRAYGYRRANIDWSGILARLPEEFTSEDVARICNRPVEHVYYRISRWKSEKKIAYIKGRKGEYRKLASA